MYFRHQTTIHDFQMVNITANTLCTRENPLNMKEGNPWFGYVGRLTSSLRSLSSCSRSFLLDTMHTFLLDTMHTILLDTMHTFLLDTMHTFLLDTMYTFLLDSASEFSIIVNRSFAVGAYVLDIGFVKEDQNLLAQWEGNKLQVEWTL